ncbi:S-adenosyl-L-methionine-dependent methyltransferase [Xylaria palmicola]|nr:S-adenosyl-L-methionine-dependent methyltransferase [Xylaria palmicola]
MSDTLKTAYDAEAGNYDSFWSDTTSPFVRLETELFASALGRVPGAVILDLAGGSGIKARHALKEGAASVDIVDFSREMMASGQEIEKRLGRDATRWFEADISKPLDHLPLHGQYDIVMAHWAFDHADNMAILEGMLRNISAYLKPGGRFLNVRAGNPRSPAMTNGDLGVVWKDFEEIPGGLRFRYSFNNHDSTIEATCMEATYSGSTEIYEKHRLVDVQIEPYENTQVVKENPKLWETFLQDPSMAVVKATKKS